MGTRGAVDMGGRLMDTFQLRPYREGDETEINRVFNEVFHKERLLEEWRWKFQGTGGTPPIVLGLIDGDICTQYAGIAEKFNWENREIDAVQIVDVFSTKKARSFARKGAWVRTVEEFFSRFGAGGEYPLLYGFPGKRALRLGVLQLGYDALPPQPVTQFERIPHKPPFRPRRLAYRARLLDAADRDLLDEFWMRVRDFYPFSVIRNGQRMQRRFFSRPGNPYHVFGFFPRFSRKPVGWAVFRISDDVCRWVDLVWDHDVPGVLELMSLLGHRLARQSGCSREEIWLNGDPEALEFLLERGFSPVEKELPIAFVARSFDPSLDVERLAGRIHLTMSDTDLV